MIFRAWGIFPGKCDIAMKALLTGGTGFVGGHVADLLLEEGHNVRLLSRRPTLPERLNGRGLEHASGNLENPRSVIDAMDAIDVFFHVGEIRSSSISACRKNVELMAGIVSSADEKSIKRIVFVSSITVAGIPSAVPATEDAAPAVRLDDQYTSYKRTCEQMLADDPSGADYAIVRPGIVIGPRSINLKKMLSAAEKIGTLALPFVGAGRNIAPFIHVKDLAKAIYFAGVKPAGSKRTFNITDGLPHTWRELFDAIGEAASRKLRILPLPPQCLEIPAAVIDCLAPALDIRPDLRKYVHYFSRDLYFSNETAKNVLGWEPLHQDLKRDIKEMIGAAST
jgi:nucleoside-diphosphate-sugar epimerase